MFLDELIITNQGKVVRFVKFKIGLNLVLDNTPSGNIGSGNNVGKTTLLRTVDYCLGGKIDRIYTDKETGSENEIIKDFLQDERTVISLKLYSQNSKIEIVRRFNSQPIINGVEKSVAEFEVEVGQLLFKLKSNKPSLRQVLSKFIRLESYQLDHIYKFLFTMATKEDYEFTYLYLFGFTEHQLLSEKGRLINKLKRLIKSKTALGSLKPGLLKQAVSALDKDISAKEVDALQFNVTDSTKNEIARLDVIRVELANNSLSLSEINTKLNMSFQTIENLEYTKTEIDQRSIEEVYAQAKRYLRVISKSFAEVVQFHNSMVSNKVNFVKSLISQLESQREHFASKVNELTLSEQELLKSVAKTGAFEGFKKINQEIGLLKEERGRKNGILKELQDVESQMNEVSGAISEVNVKISMFQKRLEFNVAKFNEFYRRYSSILYGEEYLLSAEKNDNDVYEFNVSPMRDGAVGAGKKKGQVVAFDLAYLKFLEDRRADTCRFQMNDRLEEIHFNQLEKLFSIANGIEGQLIVPILRERIAALGEDFLRANTIISMSQDEKFFKLPG